MDTQFDKLKVLAVDDNRTNLHIIKVFLNKLGHEAILAENGVEAIEKYKSEQPDLILMDIMMPVMDGFTAAREIKALTPKWVPLIFVSAMNRDENLVEGLEAGGDDYLTKPINFVVLEAKIRSMRRSLVLQQTAENSLKRVMEVSAELQTYYEQNEQEHALARRLVEMQLHRPGLQEPNFHYWIEPNTTFSGDIIAGAKSSNGKLYAMLADATGHGLGAAISALPILAIFYRMTKLGRSITEILDEMNGQLKESVPMGRFVAVTIVSFDATSRQGEIWVGGTPPALLLDRWGREKQHFASTNLPLGILANEEMSLEATQFTWEDDAQLVLFSDGLIEAENSAGEAFGPQRLHECLAHTDKADRLQLIRTALKGHLGETNPQDDVSVLLIDCPK